MTERELAYEKKFKKLLDTLRSQAEAVWVLVRKKDEQTRLRLDPMVEGIGGKLRELDSLVRELPQMTRDDFEGRIHRIEGVLLDVLILQNLIMAELLNIPKR
jgi:hypothetical protein